MVVLENITIQIGTQSFFENTSLRMESGEHWAFVGPSGSGKTVLAKAICKKERIIGGKIKYFLNDTFSASPGLPTFKPGEILMLSSETHQAFFRKFAHFHQARWHSMEGNDIPSVEALLSFQKIPHTSYSEAEFNARRAEIFQLLHLDMLAQKKVISLSHGESRKVFLARLLLHNPKLLVLDEPMTGLDEESRKSLSGFIHGILTTKKPQIIYLSSTPDDIPGEIGKVAVIDQFRLVNQGVRDAILNSDRVGEIFKTSASGSDRQEETGSFFRVIEDYKRNLEKELLDSKPVIEMENISVQYDQAVLLSNVNWTVQQGERWALLGPNGAGKSTLLSLILGDNPQAYQNKISLFGRRRGSGESIWEIKRKIGWVSPELHIFYPRPVSGTEVILSGFFDSAGLFKTSTTQQKGMAQTWIDALGLAELAPQQFWSLSAGQQRLILLARALVKNPPLLVLDEPCQGLDASQTRKFMGLVDLICSYLPVSLIYVTHIRKEIPDAVHQVIRLNHGTAVVSTLV